MVEPRYAKASRGMLADTPAEVAEFFKTCVSCAAVVELADLPAGLAE